jgi:hypothetical protein
MRVCCTMTSPRDAQLRALGRDFARLTERRQELDANPDDDAARLGTDQRWIEVARAIAAVSGSGWMALRVKAGTFRASDEAGASDAAWDMARSVMEDIVSH